MAISYDDPRTQPKQTPIPKPKSKGVIYGDAQDSDLITQQQRKYPKYGPQMNDWYNSYLYQMSLNRQNVGEEDREYLPGGRTRNQERFIQAPNMGGGNSGLGIGNIDIPSFGVGDTPDTVKFVNPTPVVKQLPTAPKQPTILDIVKQLYLWGNPDNIPGGEDQPKVKFPWEGLQNPFAEPEDKSSVLDEYYRTRLINGVDPLATSAYKFYDPTQDPDDTEYRWGLRDLWKERAAKQLTTPPKTITYSNQDQNQEWPYEYPWGGYGGYGGYSGASYSDALQNYYNALMNWRI